jgi:HD-GYP domain-containing protein (c-di-GMP phosphodiesterase class II)
MQFESDLSRPIPPALNQLAAALTEAIEKKDRYTGGHVKRTAHFALKIARELP